MVEVSEASSSDIDRLVELEAALFLEDAGRHDPNTDSTWRAREGRKDFEDLIASPDGVVLAARSSGTIIGLLAGYAAMASPTRQPVKYAALRTMYIDESARREGAAMKLTECFLDWAREPGCIEAHVDHYVANVVAAALYDRCGFEARSVSRALEL